MLSHEFRNVRKKDSQTAREFTSYMLELARQIKAAGGAEITDLDFFTTVLLACKTCQDSLSW